MACDVCEKVVKNKWYLRKHLVTAHGAPLKRSKAGGGGSNNNAAGNNSNTRNNNLGSNSKDDEDDDDDEDEEIVVDVPDGDKKKLTLVN